MSRKTDIINYIEENGKATVETLRKELGISRQIIHRHLRDLQKTGLIKKIGTPPTVYYIETKEKTYESIELDNDLETFLETNYLWISPTGQIIEGKQGFEAWTYSIKMHKRTKALAEEFKKIRLEADKYKTRKGYINATEKVKDTFEEAYIDYVYFLDFYSLPKFGKTPTGQKVLHAKQAQQEKMIKELAINSKEAVLDIIKRHKIEAISYIPPTIPRNIQFMKVLEDNLNLGLAKIDLVKAYGGEIPIAQKTLNKLEQRIENAEESIHIKNTKVSYKSVLLIDDAVGSGASLNSVAMKLKTNNMAKTVVGFSLVGSYKGFDVISEV